MLAFREQAVPGVALVEVDGPLRAPVGVELRAGVEAVLRCGQRLLLVDLGRVTEIDAAGIGELVDVYSTVAATNGVLRLTHLTARVRALLDRAGLLDVLSADWMCCREKCS